MAAAGKRGSDPYALLTARAAKAPPGCEGLFFLPYLTGERSPHADPHARGAWIGLTARTGRNELIRSVIEGATFAMGDVVDILRGRGLRIRQVRLAGGGAQSAFWRQVQADVYGVPCATLNSTEGAAYGAAILAAVGTGRFASVPQACDATIRATRVIRPNPKRRRLYARLHTQYDRLYPALKDDFARMARL